jgi:hypothetical protein
MIYPMENLFRDRVDYEAEIEDLLEELIGEDEGFEDISISSSVYEPVLVGLKDHKLETLLEKAFYPQSDTEIAVKDSEGNVFIIPIDDLQFLAFVNRPLQIDIANIINVAEVIETFCGSAFTVKIPRIQNFAAGFFGITLDPADRYKFIFFNFNNIRIRYQQRPIGEIIVERKILSEDILQDVLSKQNQLRSLRLGEIIAKRTNQLPHIVEKALLQAWQKGPENNKQFSGDILIEAGLASPQEVEESLAIQKRLRRMKVGKLLVEMGHINELQRYEVLAEKYRMRFIDLAGITIAEEVLSCLADELVKKLIVVPVQFQDDRLILATSFPDQAGLSDMLRAKLSCPFELVVSPYSQVAEIIGNHFGGERFVQEQRIIDL